MRFVKMHGFGNDFVVLGSEVAVGPSLVRDLCDRRFGIGADGVLQVGFGRVVTMGYWNADGSEAEMCGNGLRCVARRALDLGLVTSNRFEVRTPAGIKRVRVGSDLVSVELGPVELTGHAELAGYDLSLVDVGNPHAVAEADPSGVDLERVGPSIEDHERFPEGVNVEFFLPTGASAVRMRVWERGVGETLACGTGMVAVAVAARARGSVKGERITVEVPGGVGTVDFEDGVWLTGPAETVFEGTWLSEPS